jgi:hypothetical protein
LGAILLQEWNDETFNLELLAAIIPLTLGCCSLIAPGVYPVDCEAEYLKTVVHSVSFYLASEDICPNGICIP